MTSHRRRSDVDYAALTASVRRRGMELGFQQVAVTGIDLGGDEAALLAWLDAGYHGELRYMARHGVRRARPAALVPGTIRVVSVRMDYRRGGADPEAVLGDPALGYVSRYALGRDYHKLVRRRLQRLADHIESEAGPFGYRAFADSAPVMEKPLARNAGLGWIGKHTNLINKAAGSWFFLGELYTDLPLETDAPAADHCGTCRACIDACPTGAIVAPYRLDARLCISYLTIELHGPIPVDLRPLVGNRIFGCDDCQLVCPWNRFARTSPEAGFDPRHGLDAAALVDLFAWSREDYETRTEGMALRRLGYERWLRNLAVALGNAPPSPAVVSALASRRDDPSALVREHVEWALSRHREAASSLAGGTPALPGAPLGRHSRESVRQAGIHSAGPVAARNPLGMSGRDVSARNRNADNRAAGPAPAGAATASPKRDGPEEKTTDRETTMDDIKTAIEAAFERRGDISPGHAEPDVKEAVTEAIALLDEGKARVAEPAADGWVVNEWLKKAVLLSFRLDDSRVMEGGFTRYFDKVPAKYATMDDAGFRERGVRVVPPAVVRRGAYVAPGVVLMPSYVNLGAYVDGGTMVDTWATVGSCAQIGRNVHLSGGVGIGGVLEPLQASPTIIEDDCFIGARSEIVEGVVVERGSVVSMGVYVGRSTRIYDRESGEVSFGRIPAGSVVVSGNLPSADGRYSLYCAVIVKRVDERTRSKVGINELLRTL